MHSLRPWWTPNNVQPEDPFNYSGSVFGWGLDPTTRSARTWLDNGCVIRGFQWVNVNLGAEDTPISCVPTWDTLTSSGKMLLAKVGVDVRAKYTWLFFGDFRLGPKGWGEKEGMH